MANEGEIADLGSCLESSLCTNVIYYPINVPYYPILCRHSGGSRNPGVAGAGIQLFQYVTKALDTGVRPRIQAFLGRLGDEKKAIFSHVLPALLGDGAGGKARN